MSAAPPNRRVLTAGLLLLAFNLRPAVTSIGPLLDELRAELGVSNVYAGVLTTLPVLSFAVFGVIGPAVVRRSSAERVVLVSLILVIAGLSVRALTGSPVVFMVMSALALAAIAVANVLMPVFVIRHFPDRIGVMTALYTTAMGIGAAVAAGVSVPVAQAAGWRYGLGIWGVAAALALPPWWRRSPPPAASSQDARRPRLRDLASQPLAWAVLVYFGTQSLGAYVVFGWLPEIYRAAGLDTGTAGLLLTVATVVAIPISLVVPALAARSTSQRGQVAFFVVCYAAAFVGLLVAPRAGAPVWALLLGVAAGAFPLSLTILALRSATPGTTAALSAFAQSGGYLIAAAGPVTVGVLHGATGGWTWPLLFVILAVAAQLPAGLVAGRGGVVTVDARARPQP